MQPDSGPFGTRETMDGFHPLGDGERHQDVDFEFHLTRSSTNVVPSRQNIVWEGNHLGCSSMPQSVLSLTLRSPSDDWGSPRVSPTTSRRQSTAGGPDSPRPLSRAATPSSVAGKSDDGWPPSGHEHLPDALNTLKMSEATFNLVNTVVGVGVLSVPYAFRLSGYITLLVMAFTILVTWYTAKLLGASSVLAASSEIATWVPPKSRDYIFLAYVGFGSWGKRVMMTITAMEMWFAVVTFIVMNGVNGAILWPKIGNGLVIVVSAVSAGFMVFLPMRVYSYVSLISTGALLLAGCALVGAAASMPYWANPYQTTGEDSLMTLRNVPRSAGILVFCFAGHPCFPVIHECMREKKAWGGAVGLTFMTAFFYYAGLGVFGYIVFGTGLEASFTENIAAVKHALFWKNVSVLAFLVKIQLTTPVIMNAIMVSLWAPGSNSPEWPPGRVALLFTLVAFTAIVCYFCANSVASVASLSGSLFVMSTSVIFPVVVHMRLSYLYGKRTESTWSKVVRWCIAIGLLMVSFGEVVAGTALAAADLLAAGSATVSP